MDVFEVLADPTRREVVRLLGERPRRPAELAEVLGSSRPVMSRHLRILLQAGLVRDERTNADARARIFRLRPESLVAVQAFLDQVQADWKVQLASFKQHIDEREGT
ncbi:MAG TPA: metalloregulator ArsR/SmtB family transcription factor [Acidimicrobiales bacterium]